MTYSEQTEDERRAVDHAHDHITQVGTAGPAFVAGMLELDDEHLARDMLAAWGLTDPDDDEQLDFWTWAVSQARARIARDYGRESQGGCVRELTDGEAVRRLVAEGLPVERARGLVGLTREMGWNGWRKGGAK